VSKKRQQRVYVLTLKTWKEYDRAHHTYGRIHWSDDAGHGSEDSYTLPDADGDTSIRHNSTESAVEGALRWFRENAKRGDALVLAQWTLAGWDPCLPYTVLKGKVKASSVRSCCD
jgi:hypothetical protein